MWKEKIPDHLENQPVELVRASGETEAAAVFFKEWTSKESFTRGFKKAFKIAFILGLIALPFGVLEPFLFMIWGSVFFGILLLFLGPLLHLKYWKEKFSFYFVEGRCSSCGFQGRLKPYVETALQTEFTVICPQCGQTHRARVNASLRETLLKGQ